MRRPVFKASDQVRSKLGCSDKRWTRGLDIAHRVQPRMISVVNFFVLLRLLIFALLLLYVT